MPAALRIPKERQAGLGSRSVPFRPIAHLLGGIWAIESVKKIKLSTDEEQVDLWVLVQQDVPEDERAIWRLEREYRGAVEPLAFELHLVALNEIDEAVLPPAETIFER